MMQATFCIIAAICALGTMSCTKGEWRWSEAAQREGKAAAGLTVQWSASPGITGWLYSYGISWEPCEEVSLAEWLGVSSRAQASHPLTFDDPTQWLWQSPIAVGAEGLEQFERALTPGRYCGLRWLFSHGGKPMNDILASMRIETSDRVLADAAHAAVITLLFDEPVCVDPTVPKVELILDTSRWLAAITDASTPQLGARDAWLSLADSIEVQTSACP